MLLFDVLKTGLKVAAKYIGGDVGDKIKEVSGKIEEASSTNPELRKAMLDQELEIKKIYAADFADARQLIREESRSEDPFVRRSRPAFLWLFYLIIVFNFAIFPIVSIFYPYFKVVYPDLPTPLYTLFGTAFVGYAGFRSFDKRTKAKADKGL